MASSGRRRPPISARGGRSPGASRSRATRAATGCHSRAATSPVATVEQHDHAGGEWTGARADAADRDQHGTADRGQQCGIGDQLGAPAGTLRPAGDGDGEHDGGQRRARARPAPQTGPPGRPPTTARRTDPGRGSATHGDPGQHPDQPADHHGQQRLDRRGEHDLAGRGAAPAQQPADQLLPAPEPGGDRPCRSRAAGCRRRRPGPRAGRRRPWPGRSPRSPRRRASRWTAGPRWH